MYCFQLFSFLIFGKFQVFTLCKALFEIPEIQRWRGGTCPQNSKSWVKSVFFFTWPYLTWKYVQAYVSYRAENHSFPILGIEEPLTLALFLFFNCGKIYMTSNWLLGIFKCTSQGDFYSLHNLSFKEHLCRALLEKHEAVKEVDVQIFHFFFFSWIKITFFPLPPFLIFLHIYFGSWTIAKFL